MISTVLVTGWTFVKYSIICLDTSVSYCDGHSNILMVASSQPHSCFFLCFIPQVFTTSAWSLFRHMATIHFGNQPGRGSQSGLSHDSPFILSLSFPVWHFLSFSPSLATSAWPSRYLPARSQGPLELLHRRAIVEGALWSRHRSHLFSHCAAR